MRPDASPLFISLAALSLSLAAAGCSGDDDSPPTPPQSTASTAETGMGDTASTFTGSPAQVVDHEGSVVLMRDPTLREGQNGYFRLYGIFGSDLRGVGTGQLCLEAGVCIHELPERAGEFVELDRYFRTTEMDYDWVGERVAIGNSPRDWMEMPFVYSVGSSASEDVEVPEFGYYLGSVSRLDRDEIPPLGVRIEEGQWGDNVEVEAEDGIPLPQLPRLISPSTTTINPSDVVSFNWTWPVDPPPPEPPIDRGDTPLYLRVRSNELHRIYRLPDEGPVNVQLGGFGLNPTSDLEFYFGRWSQTEARISRNDLHVYGGVEQRIGTTGCSVTGLPRVNLSGDSSGNELPTLAVASIGVSFDGLIVDDGVYDYGWDATGAGTPDPTSSSLTFTAYDDEQQALCTVRYDASRATSVPTSSVTVANAGRVFAAFELDLSEGVSDCNHLDTPVFEGYPTLTQALESTRWQFAIGEMGASAGPLAQAYGDDWDTVEGQMYGLYAQRLIRSNFDRCPGADDVFLDVELGAVEVGAGFLYQTEDCGVMNPELVPLQYRPGKPMKSGVYSTSPALPFDAVLPTCPPPDLGAAQ